MPWQAHAPRARDGDPIAILTVAAFLVTLGTMPKSDKAPPRLTPEGERAAAARQERLTAALRANLARRKAQSRERAAAEDDKKA